METEELKKKLDEAIEADAEEIQRTGEMIAGHPEIGFREFRTSEFVKNQLSELGLSVRSGMAITGLRADLPGAESRCRIAYFAELDALVCHGHPQADPATGAAHACGHNIQMAVMLGVARAMMRTQAARHLAGDIAFVAVPAEELGQIEYRNGLREEGKLSFLTGKQELIATGVLDDIDMALMCHMQIPKVAGKLVTVGATMNGALAKYIHYKGCAAHAGSAPHLGINALNAALLGLQAVHCLRETFREEDCIRVHPIITQGGALVNSVPDDVRLELFVRAKSVSALDETSRRVDRAFRAGADAIGAAAEISTLPGYMPLIPYPELDQVWAKNAVAVLGADKVGQCPHINGSTDMGDVSQIMPAVHAWTHVVEGKLHGSDFRISDPHLAYVQTARIAARSLVDLLADRAERALRIRKESRPPMTRETWLQSWKEKTSR